WISAFTFMVDPRSVAASPLLRTSSAHEMVVVLRDRAYDGRAIAVQAVFLEVVANDRGLDDEPRDQDACGHHAPPPLGEERLEAAEREVDRHGKRDVERMRLRAADREREADDQEQQQPDGHHAHAIPLRAIEAPEQAGEIPDRLRDTDDEHEGGEG